MCGVLLCFGLGHPCPQSCEKCISFIPSHHSCFLVVAVGVTNGPRQTCTNLCHQPVTLPALGSPDTVVFKFHHSLPCFHPRARILDVFPSRRLPVNLSPWEPVLLQKTCLPWKAVLILQKFPVPLLRSFLKSSACVSQWFLTVTLQDCLGNCVVLVPYEIRCCF